MQIQQYLMTASDKNPIVFNDMLCERAWEDTELKRRAFWKKSIPTGLHTVYRLRGGGWGGEIGRIADLKKNTSSSTFLNVSLYKTTVWLFKYIFILLGDCAHFFGL